MLDAHPDLVSILVGVNDNSWHTLDPSGHEISADEFAAGYDRLLASLAGTGTEIILIEPFLLPIHGVVEAGIHRDGESGATLIDDDVRRASRTGLTPKIAAVRQLAVEYGTHLLAADGMFAGLAARTGPEHWSEDGVHPTPAGHAALADAWLRLPARSGSRTRAAATLLCLPTGRGRDDHRSQPGTGGTGRTGHGLAEEAELWCART